MTTHSTAGKHATLLRAGCDRKTSAQASVLTGSVAVLATGASGLLYFDNLYGPLGDHPHLLGTLAGLACGFLAGAAVFSFTGWVARRSRFLLIVLVGAVLASAWVLLPRQINVSESFFPRANARWACTGWSFLHYPPDTFDAAATTYCVGLEKRIAHG